MVDLWDFKDSFTLNQGDFKLLSGMNPWMGPQKSQQKVRVDIALGNYFKACCQQRGVTFTRGERQRPKAMEVGIQRDFEMDDVHIDDLRVLWWDYKENEIRWDATKLLSIRIDVEKMKLEALRFAKPTRS